MQNYHSKLKIKFLLFVTCCLLFPFQVLGVVLYLEPAQGEYSLGETFIEEIRIDTEGDCINVIGADLNFSQDTLEAIDFSQGNSILTLWVKPPSIDQEAGQISFAGGIPGGYCGEIPGASEKSNLLGKIIFRVKEISDKERAEINFSENSQVLLNDGFGTQARLTLKGAVFSILAEEMKVAEDKWRKEIEKDSIPPEEFLAEIGQSSAIFEGKYFLTFSTTDKQTGIDHYEVAEQKRIMLIFSGKEKYKIAQSPYLLEDQSLTSKILVKAIDKAGNERIEIIIPKISWQDLLPWLIIVLVLIAVIWWLIKKYRKK